MSPFPGPRMGIPEGLCRFWMGIFGRLLCRSHRTDARRILWRKASSSCRQWYGGTVYRFKLAGIENGDEVLAPALTFAATANAVAYCGATPHLIDSELVPSGMDPAKLDFYLREIRHTDGSVHVTGLRELESGQLCRCTHLVTLWIWILLLNFVGGGSLK